MRRSLLELYREFLPAVYSDAEMNAVSFTASVSTYTQVKTDDDGKGIEKEFQTWETFFNIRFGNTSIRLHNIPFDPEFIHMERKMALLEEGLTTFSKAVKERMKKPADSNLFRREWLNPEELGADYTGYFFYNIEPTGTSRLFIADCHRTINFWIDVYPSDKKHTMAKRQLALLEGIVKAIGAWRKQVKKLRKDFHKKEKNNGKV